jgi:Methyltransferase domain
MSAPSKIDDFFKTPVKRGSDGKEYHLTATSLRFSEAMTMFQLVNDTGARRIFEIGTALGASAVAIAEALEVRGGEGHLITIDPYPGAFGNVGASELARLGLASVAEFQPVFAEDFLPEAARRSQHFDMILIDGPHSVGIKMTHTFFADPCLAPGGTMVFHDGFMPSTAACVKFLVREHGYVPVTLPPDVPWKRWARVCKCALIHGPSYAWNIVRRSHRSLVALREPARQTTDT